MEARVMAPDRSRECLGAVYPYLYAFDKATGEEVWRGATPHRTNGTPMTYRTSSRRQFVVVATAEN